MESKREERKRTHITHAVSLEDGPLFAGWDDIHLVHQALAQYDLKEIDTEITLFGKKIRQPLIINAITGGAAGLDKINSSLARVAKEAGVGLAVGSQTAGLQNKEVRHTYEIVRKINPHGLVMANISALAKPQEARAAVEMIEADVLQIHLNSTQELLMAEGDREFVRTQENIRQIIEEVPVPCLVKEVGFGISKETAARLYELGVRSIDISGAGGTNFAAIELARKPQQESWDSMRFWGITSACSLLEVASLRLPFSIIASGGIVSSLDIVKALGLGADAAAIAGFFLKILVQKGEEELLKSVQKIQEELKILLLMVGARTIADLSAIPLVVSGFTRTWCEQRGIDLSHYAKRNKLFR